MDGYAGLFSLATAVYGHAAGTQVRVTVSGPNPSRLVLDFSNDRRVLTDARVLLCGHVGALELVELGYTGPLARRPRLSLRKGAQPLRLQGTFEVEPAGLEPATSWVRSRRSPS